MISVFLPLRVSFLHLRRCGPADTTPSSYVCCGTPHAPTPSAARSVREKRCATHFRMQVKGTTLLAKVHHVYIKGVKGHAWLIRLAPMEGSRTLSLEQMI